MDEDGAFRVTAAAAATFIGRIKERFVKAEEVNVKEAVLGDLQRINTTVQSESKALKASDASKHEIGKKLLFLFQCDLLPGISGKILEQKGGRDFAKVKPVSAVSKIMGYTLLFLMNAGMLFYILLFALTQTGPRQNAWFKSFALWLVVEIFMVSTAIVFFTHILIPSLVMKDLTQIKRRLMDNIRDFNEKVSAAKTNPNALTEAEDAQKISFNAANYLFVSTRLARQFPDLKESKIIAQFSTPWPRQSYLHVQNVSKGYSKKFSALTRSASILIIFFVGNFLAVPPSVQDIAVQMTSTVALGYGLFIHLQLYEIYPVLVIVPTLLIGVLVHFYIQSGKADAKNKLARLFPAPKKKNCDFGPISKEINDFGIECSTGAVVLEVGGEETKYNDGSVDDCSASTEDLEEEETEATYTYGLHILANALTPGGCLEHLQLLDLSHNNITAEGLGVLSEGISLNTSLTSLNLDYNPVFDFLEPNTIGLYSLASAIKDKSVLLENLSIQAPKMSLKYEGIVRKLALKMREQTPALPEENEEGQVEVRQ